jgi:hypothetical protein
MPWTADYFGDGAYVKFSGAIKGEEIVRANSDFYAHAYKDGPRFAVFDFSETVQFDVDRTAVDRIAAQDVVAAAAVVPELTVAVVAPQMVVYGMARMWELQIGGTEWRTTIARSRSEALAWLAEQGIATDRFAVLAD